MWVMIDDVMVVSRILRCWFFPYLVELLRLIFMWVQGAKKMDD
jgi:hypothetical protein